LSEDTPSLHRVRDIIRSGPFSKPKFYRLVGEGRIELIHVGKRMSFTKESGNEIALRIAREDAGELPAEKDAVT
jgi:hypothetical protein